MPSLLESLGIDIDPSELIGEENKIGRALLDYRKAHANELSTAEIETIAEQVCVLENLYRIADIFSDQLDHPLSHLADDHDMIEAANFVQAGLKLMIKAAVYEQTLLRIYRLHADAYLSLDEVQKALTSINERIGVLAAASNEVPSTEGFH